MKEEKKQMKEGKKQSGLDIMMIVGVFLMGIGFAALLINYLGKVGVIANMIIGIGCIILSYYVRRAK